MDRVENTICRWLGEREKVVAKWLVRPWMEEEGDGQGGEGDLRVVEMLLEGG